MHTIMPEAGPQAALCNIREKELPVKLTALKSKRKDRQKLGLKGEQAKKASQRARNKSGLRNSSMDI